MPCGVEKNDDPLISLLGTDHTCTQGHDEVAHPVVIARENADVETPLSRPPTVIRPIRPLVDLTDLRTQPGAGSRPPGYCVRSTWWTYCRDDVSGTCGPS